MQTGKIMAGKEICPPALVTSLRQDYNWQPRYNVNIPGFDSENRPYIRSRNADAHTIPYSVFTIRDGKWVELPFKDSLSRGIKRIFGDAAEIENTRFAGGFQISRVVFDRNDTAYTLLRVAVSGHGWRYFLLYSNDHCRSWEVEVLPDGLYATMEESYSPDPISGPPALLVWKRIDQLKHYRDQKRPAWVGTYGYLRLLSPMFIDGKLSIGREAFVSANAIPIVYHSGGSSRLISRGDKIYVLWDEVEPDLSASGMPVRCATFRRSPDGPQLCDGPVELFRSRPLNDTHNTAGMVMDGKGYLHVLTGTHNGYVYHLQSLRPEDIQSGWSKPQRILTYVPDALDDDSNPTVSDWEGYQTYPALAIGRDDSMYVACREKRGMFCALSLQRKRYNGAWEKSVPLLRPPKGYSGYTVYYHKLSFDRKGNLYLGFSFYTLKDEPVHQYAGLLKLKDGKYILPETEDFQKELMP